MNFEAQKICPVCHENNFKHVLSSCDYKTYTDQIEYHLARCQACGFVMQTNPPQPTELARYYPSDYYSYNSSQDLLSILKEKARLITKPIPFLHKLILFQDCLLECTDQEKKLLDAGCGDGAALKTLRSLGWRHLFGTEINPQVVESLTKQGFQARQASDLASSGFEPQQFDTIRMYHVLEHVYDPSKEIKTAHGILKPGGQLLLGLPNFDSIYRKIFGRYFFALQLPTHISHFNPQTIHRLLENEGFRIVKLKTGGWFGLAQSLAIWAKIKLGLNLPGQIITLMTAAFLPVSVIVLLFRSGPVMNVWAVKE
jgi:2-polyprenyl-3-methyl-5-hydroxy-6-metoxy-1,4-benzoquinol methylase